MKLLRQHPQLPPTPRYGAAGNPLPQGEEATTRLARATRGSARASRADCGASPEGAIASMRDACAPQNIGPSRKTYRVCRYRYARQLRIDQLRPARYSDDGVGEFAETRCRSR